MINCRLICESMIKMMLIWILLFALCLFPNFTNRNCNEGKSKIKPRDSIRPSYLNNSMRVSQLSIRITQYRDSRMTKKIWLPVLNEVSELWYTVNSHSNDIINMFVQMVWPPFQYEMVCLCFTEIAVLEFRIGGTQYEIASTFHLERDIRHH